MSVGGIAFHWYGLLIGLGVLAAGYASSWVARRRQIDEEVVWRGLWWAIIPGIVGARAYHVADLWGEIYRLDPWSVLAIWRGGLGILGGIIGGVIGLWLYYRLMGKRYKLPPLFLLMETFFFGLPLGQAIGRIGNLINQEVYGTPTTLPWAIEIIPSKRLRGWEKYSTYHPLFAYELLWLLMGFLIMYRLVLRKSPFSLLGFYLIWYGMGRYFLEQLRPAEFVWVWREINLAQTLSLAMVVGGLVLIRKKAAPRFP